MRQGDIVDFKFPGLFVVLSSVFDPKQIDSPTRLFGISNHFWHRKAGISQTN